LSAQRTTGIENENKGEKDGTHHPGLRLETHPEQPTSHRRHTPADLHQELFESRIVRTSHAAECDDPTREHLSRHESLPKNADSNSSTIQHLHSAQLQDIERALFGPLNSPTTNFTALSSRAKL
jgi:hypothetical protein